MWLTGELRPDPDLAGRFCRDLERLRHKFADQYPVVAEHRFQAAWASRQLNVKFSDPAAAAVRERRYDGRNALSAALRLDTLLRSPNRINWGAVGFGDVSHVERLAPRYNNRALPGLLEREPNYIVFVGFSTHPLLPLWDGETLGLVLTGGSSHSPDHFFRICDGHPEFVDRWDGGDNQPRWLQKAWEAWEERTDSDS